MRSATEEPREKGEIGQIGESEGEKGRERERRTLYRIYSTEMKIPFAVRYIKLVVECFESYHSHFDELGPQNRSSRTVRCVGVSLRSNMLNARLD